jgi:hypothetical protein
VARRSLAASLDGIAELAQSLAPVLEDAADAGSRQSGNGLVTVGRAKGIADKDPTGTAALDPRRSQIRRAVRRAGFLVDRAEERAKK